MAELCPDPDQRLLRMLAFVENLERESRNASRAKLTPSVQRNLDRSFAQMHEFNLDPSKSAIAVDADA